MRILRRLCLAAGIVLLGLIASGSTKDAAPPCEPFPDGTQPACIYPHLSPDTLVGDIYIRDMWVSEQDILIASAVNGWRSSFHPAAQGHEVRFIFRNIQEPGNPNAGMLYTYQDVSRVVRIPAASAQTLDVPLAPYKRYIRGTLELTCDLRNYTGEDARCAVSIDGMVQAASIAPGQKASYILNPGAHTVVATLAGSHANRWSPGSVSQTVTIAANATPRRVVATFQKAALVTLTLDQPQAAADFYVDGQLVASQVLSYQGYVSPNKTHRFDAKNITDPAAKGVYRWRDATRSIYLSAAAVRTITFRLQKQWLKGWLEIACQVTNSTAAPGAHCQPEIDGAAADPIAANATGQVALDPGQHTVIVRAGPAAEWTAPPVTFQPMITAGQTTRMTAMLTVEPAPEPGTLLLAHSFAGPEAGQTGAADVGIAAGPASLLATTNGPLLLLDKTGGVIASGTLGAMFGAVRQPQQGIADPRAVYDPASERFFLVAQGWVPDPACTPGASCISHFFLGVSKGSNPRSFDAANWYLYALDATLDRTSQGAVATTTWADFTSIGVNDDMVVLTANMDSFVDESNVTAKIRVVDKSLLIQGAPITTWTDFVGMRHPGSTSKVFNIMPALHYTPSNAFWLVGPSGCGFMLYTISGTASAPSLSQRHVNAGGDCSTAPAAPQPGSDLTLASNWGGILTQRPAYSGGSLWAAESIAWDFGSGPVAAIRWVQIDASAGQIVQERLLGSDGVWHIFPAIAANPRGDVALVFSRSSRTVYPSAYYTGRLSGDPAGTLRPVGLLRAGTTAFTSMLSSCCGQVRWGDYLDVSIDPDDGTAWIAGQYVKTASDWGVWIGHLDWSSAGP